MGRPACLLGAAAVGSRVGHTLLGKEEMPLPLKPSPASKVLVTTEATVAWLPLEEGPIPVAMDTKEKGSPEEVQVEEPELMGAMSAEEAGEAVGLRRSPGAKGKKTRAESISRGPNTLSVVIFPLFFSPFPHKHHSAILLF